MTHLEELQEKITVQAEQIKKLEKELKYQTARGNVYKMRYDKSRADLDNQKDWWYTK